MVIQSLRSKYHDRICTEIIRISVSRKGERYPNFADVSSASSKEIAWSITKQLNCPENDRNIKGQSAGSLFEKVTKDFIEACFNRLLHLRPGEWSYTTNTAISTFSQYEHLAHVQAVIKQDETLRSALGGDYIITPDIVVSRLPISDGTINKFETLLSDRKVARFTPLRNANADKQIPILHASISCKWSIRSDRAQNTRSEALNLIRNRKGHLPHIVAVTAEPLPTRIASLALGTGDLDCVYHFALHELETAVRESGNEDQLDMLETLIEGKRLRDISDLPFDLAI